MGIECEINLIKTLDDIYKPGYPVPGTIRYSVDKTTTFTEIIVSLKGKGHTLIISTINRAIFYENKETLVDIDNVITEKDKPLTVPIGSQSLQFHFVLPSNLPPSFKYSSIILTEDVKCKIEYYVRIKFKRAGALQFTKRFKKVLMLESNNITPSLPRNPIVYAERKILNNFFSSQQQIVTLKVSMHDSVINIGGKVIFECEVENLTKLIVKSLNIKLIEVYRFYKSFKDFIGNATKVSKDVEGTVKATTSISQGQTHSFNFELNIPHDVQISLENSKVVSRKYYVKITAVLPSPNKDVVLKIPLQIGCTGDDKLLSENACGGPSSVYNQSVLLGAPPSYWEVMGEDNDDN